jgi:hypothetical protein
MPRRKRGWIDGACYHITHRCHNEFYNPKQRCRIINTDRLLQALAISTLERFSKWHTLTINEMMIKQKTPEHAAFWSKAFCRWRSRLA